MIHKYLLIVIVGIGVFVRFDGLSRVGFNDYDSAYYANVAKVPLLVIEWYRSTPPEERVNEDLILYLKDRGAGARIVKPGHVALLAAGFLLFGHHDYAVLYVMAFCGAIAVLLTYMVGLRLHSEETGILAAALMAVSPQQVILSRMGYPQTDTVVLFLLAFLLFLRYRDDGRRGGNFYGFALLVGLLTLFHQSVAIPVFALALLFVVPIDRDGLKISRDGLKDAVICLLIVATIFLAAALTIQIINSLNPDGGTNLVGRNYNRVFDSGVSYFGFSTEKLLFYPEMIWRMEGAWVLAAILIGLAYCTFHAATRLAPNLRVLTTVVLATLTFWIVNYTTLKSLQVILPLLFVAASVPVVDLARRKMPVSSTWITALLAACVIGIGVVNVQPDLRVESHYDDFVREALDVVQSRGGVFTTDQNNIWPVLKFYVGEQVDRNPDLRAFVSYEIDDTPDYRVIDWVQYIPGKSDIGVLTRTTNSSDPLVSVHHLDEPRPIWHYHRYYGREDIFDIFRTYPAARYVSLYDMRSPLEEEAERSGTIN